MNSFYYRGTPEQPGLVLALDRGPEDTSCAGVAYRVGVHSVAEVRSYLYEREMLAVSAYLEAVLPVELEAEGENCLREEVQALCYVLNRNHHGYAGMLSLEVQAERIAYSRGEKGSNAEYLFNTMAHLKEMGVKEPELESLETLVRKLVGYPVV